MLLNLCAELAVSRIQGGCVSFQCADYIKLAECSMHV
jgi:hypothetical protein